MWGRNSKFTKMKAFNVLLLLLLPWGGTTLNLNYWGRVSAPESGVQKGIHSLSRGEWDASLSASALDNISTVPARVAALSLSLLLAVPSQAALADTEAPSIQPCSPDARCVSTSTVSSLRGYASPWMMGRGSLNTLTSELKGRGYKLTAVVDQFVRGVADGETVEFLLKPEDGVVLYSSSSAPSKFSLYDPRRQLESILSGAGFESAGGDTGEAKKEGFVGELKAFYGMQSGKGWEDVLEE